jgi:hypothetical protein
MPGAPTPADPRESHHAETLDRSLCSLLSAWFPGGATLSRSSSRLNDSFVLASVLLTTSPSAFTLLTRLKPLRDGACHPSGLCHSLCMLRPSCSHVLRHIPPSHSARGATLDTGGWLTLTRPGLPPGKKHQASLGAPTVKPGRSGNIFLLPDIRSATGFVTPSLTFCVMQRHPIWHKTFGRDYKSRPTL